MADENDDRMAKRQKTDEAGPASKIKFRNYVPGACHTATHTHTHTHTYIHTHPHIHMCVCVISAHLFLRLMLTFALSLALFNSNLEEALIRVC